MKRNFFFQTPPALAAVLVVFAITFSGCFMWPLPGMEMMKTPWLPGHDFHKAAFSMSGPDLMLRNDDQEVWHAATVTLDTDHGYFRQRAGEMNAGDVKALPLAKFLGEGGQPPSASIELKSVWVHTTYNDGRVADELAFPAATFGLKPVSPQAAN